jgi:hypothetical protein
MRPLSSRWWPSDSNPDGWSGSALLSPLTALSRPPPLIYLGGAGEASDEANRASRRSREAVADPARFPVHAGDVPSVPI